MSDPPRDRTTDDRRETDPFEADQTVPDADWDLVARAPVERSDPDALTVAIISAVADAEDVSFREIRHPPLYEVCDTAVLDAAFFQEENGRAHDTDATAEFMYRGHRVVVHSLGHVLVYDRDA